MHFKFSRRSVFDWLTTRYSYVFPVSSNSTRGVAMGRTRCQWLQKIKSIIFFSPKHRVFREHFGKEIFFGTFEGGKVILNSQFKREVPTQKFWGAKIYSSEPKFFGFSPIQKSWMHPRSPLPSDQPFIVTIKMVKPGNFCISKVKHVKFGLI